MEIPKKMHICYPPDSAELLYVMSWNFSCNSWTVNPTDMTFGGWVHSRGVDIHAYFEDPPPLFWLFHKNFRFQMGSWFTDDGKLESALKLHEPAHKVTCNKGQVVSWMIPLFLGYWGQGIWFWCYFNDLRPNLRYVGLVAQKLVLRSQNGH